MFCFCFAMTDTLSKIGERETGGLHRREKRGKGNEKLAGSLAITGRYFFFWKFHNEILKEKEERRIGGGERLPVCILFCARWLHRFCACKGLLFFFVQLALSLAR